MPTQAQIPDVLSAINAKLAEAARRGIRLKIADQRLEEDWLSVVVVPAQPGIRASEHAVLMSQIERELRSEGFDNVLLVPALED